MRPTKVAHIGPFAFEVVQSGGPIQPTKSYTVRISVSPICSNHAWKDPTTTSFTFNVRNSYSTEIPKDMVVDPDNRSWTEVCPTNAGVVLRSP